MKVAISSREKAIDSEIDPAFGRCQYFLIVLIDKGVVSSIEAIKNQSDDSQSMAGVHAVQLVAEKGVEAVITGRLGPRAVDALKQFKIRAYNGSGSAKNALMFFIGGKLERIC